MILFFCFVLNTDVCAHKKVQIDLYNDQLIYYFLDNLGSRHALHFFID